MLIAECVEIEQLCHLLAQDSKRRKQTVEQIGRTFFKSLLSEKAKRRSVRENIQRRGEVIGYGCGWALIHSFASHGHDLAIQLLLEKGAPIDTPCDRGTPLIVATESGYPSTVNMLLGKGANTEFKNKEGLTALQLAVLKGDESCVGFLLEAGAKMEVRDKDDQTPLIVAAKHGYEKIVRLLLNKNANMEAESVMGTALIEATLGGSEGIVKALLERGAQTEARTRNYGTALNIAASNGYEEIVGLLLKSGANVEAKDRHRKTPLMLAAQMENTAVVKILLSHGADVFAKDLNGATALGLANRLPSSKGLTLSQLTTLHMTPTVIVLVQAMKKRTNRSSLPNIIPLDVPSSSQVQQIDPGPVTG